MNKTPSSTKKDLPVRSKRPGDYLKYPVLFLLLVLLCSTGFRIYKAHYTGIINDEAWTYEDFCGDIHTAVSVYNSTNNHLLNSVFIVLTGKLAGNYEHFIRIPAVIFGIIFCCALTYIIHKTINSAVLKVIGAALILMNWFIVDLTYLARGYAIALGAVYAGIAVLVRLSARPDGQRQVGWRCVLFLIAMNFTALGAMLSSLSALVCVNAAFLIIMLVNAIKPGKKAVIGTIIRFAVVVAGSMVSLFWLYRRVLSDIPKYTRGFEVKPFAETLKEVLRRPLIYDDFTRAKSIEPIYETALTLLILCALICIGAFIFRLAAGRKTQNAFFSGPAAMVLALTAGLLSMMFVQSSVLGIPLGMPRNSVFLLPLALISAAVLMDRAGRVICGVKPLFVIQQFACVIVLAVLCYMNLPSPRSVVVRAYDWGKQSAVGPLVRALREINPQRQWKIKLVDPHTDCLSRSIRYYGYFGFKVSRAQDEYDVLICPEHRPDRRAIYFDNRRFADHHCLVVVNSASFQNEQVYYQLHRD